MNNLSKVVEEQIAPKINIRVNGKNYEFDYIPMYNVVGIENEEMNICISKVKTREEAITAAEWAIRSGYIDFQGPFYLLQSQLTHLLKEDGEVVFLDEDDNGWPTDYYVTVNYEIAKVTR